MTPSPNPIRSVGARRRVGLAVAALVAAVAGCKTTEPLDGTARPQTAISTRPATPAPILGAGY